MIVNVIGNHGHSLTNFERETGFSDEYENIDYTYCVLKKLKFLWSQSFENEIAKHISLFLVLVTGHLT